MRFHFYCPFHLEKWDHRNPDTVGIGGTEIAMVELCKRLASRGHVVHAYAPIPDDCPPTDLGGARWHRLEETHFADPGIWVLYRCPYVLGQMTAKHARQRTWLVCHDVDYTDPENGVTPERSAILDRCLVLCKAQEESFEANHPEWKGRLTRSFSGIRTDLIEEIEGLEQPVRDPYKLVYMSSPDRGLFDLLKIFRRAREFEPRLKLSIGYGWNNVDLSIERARPRWLQRLKEDVGKLVDQPGVTWCGRMPAAGVFREMLSAGLWVYPTIFTETNCCTAMEVQACGAVPVTIPWWALADNVKHGVFVFGDPQREPLVASRYLGELLKLTVCTDLQEQIRKDMVPWARDQFNWERVVDQYEALATEDMG